MQFHFHIALSSADCPPPPGALASSAKSFQLQGGQIVCIVYLKWHTCMQCHRLDQQPDCLDAYASLTQHLPSRVSAISSSQKITVESRRLHCHSGKKKRPPASPGLEPFPLGHRFAEMLRVIDSRKADLGVTGYGLSVTTMEEVFLRISEGNNPTSSSIPVVRIAIP